MSKILRTLFISVYCVLLWNLILSTHWMKETKDVIEHKYLFRTPGTLRKIERSIKKNRNHLPVFYDNFTQIQRFPTDIKFILKWTQAFSHYSSSIYKNGQMAFLAHNCSYYNCYMTNDRSLLVDLRYYDAILFDVENNWDDHPPVRAPHQRYIFTASESAGNYPICDDYLESYYNLTWTYKLNSDIQWTYIKIFDKNNKEIGPKINMTWIETMAPTPDRVKVKLRSKKRAVAWFVSNCYAKKRLEVAGDITRSLAKYDLEVDIYGWCGNKTCPRDRIEECLHLLQRDYYFYLAFENSIAEDYVTEKILYPLQHYAVPIVYGGADYSRFLPPASYIDAGKLNSDETASLIVAAINNRNVYEDYFRWHNYYVYKASASIADVCSLCKLLNTKEEISSIQNFRHWWNPNYKELCKGNHNV